MPYPDLTTLDGDLKLAGSMDSLNSPFDIPHGGFVEAVNLVNRGGLMQTRPGYQQKFTLPAGKLQGFTFFTPRRRTPVMVAVVDGQIYTSSFPYQEFEFLNPAVRLSDHADKCYFASAVQAVEVNEDGSLRLIPPRRVLVIQDGSSAPAVWDGSRLEFDTGQFGIPQGTVMAWSGSRLWVAREEKLFASDLLNPRSFREQTYNTLGGIRYFAFPAPITALAETPNLETPQLLAFTRTTTSILGSSVINRELWPEIQDFQRLIQPNIGCVSDRSVVSQHGLLWWFSEFGLTNFDSALAAKQTSRFRYLDNEMAISKSRLNGDLSGVAGAVFENYLLMSVPYADCYNRHTWVMDNLNTLAPDSGPTWNGYWTGTRPVQWASADVLGETRIFYASKDYDGHNVVWEAFVGRRDNDCDITWAYVSRAYHGQQAGPKELRWVEVMLSELAGEVDVQLRWAGAKRGRFKPIGLKRIVATEGTVRVDRDIDADEFMFALKKQSRIIRSVNVRDNPEAEDTTCAVEREGNDRAEAERIDDGFQVAVVGCGVCAVERVRVKMDAVIESPYSRCEDSEPTVDRAVRFDGAASFDLADLQVFPETFEVAATATVGEITKEGFASSPISHAAAAKVALQIAEARVSWENERTAEPFIGGELADG